MALQVSAAASLCPSGDYQVLLELYNQDHAIRPAPMPPSSIPESLGGSQLGLVMTAAPPTNPAEREDQ